MVCKQVGQKSNWLLLNLGLLCKSEFWLTLKDGGLLLCYFVLFSNSLLKFGDNIHVFLINYFYRLLRQSHKQIKFASSTFMRLVLHTLPRRTGFHRIFAPVRRATPSISLLAIKANGQTIQLLSLQQPLENCSIPSWQKVLRLFFAVRSFSPTAPTVTALHLTAVCYQNGLYVMYMNMNPDAREGRETARRLGQLAAFAASPLVRPARQNRHATQASEMREMFISTALFAVEYWCQNDKYLVTCGFGNFMEG